MGIEEEELKVFIGCEFSGIVRNEFAKRGHDAWSCDLLPASKQGNHIQGDILKHLNDGWDLLIAFPPCTYLSYAGLGHWSKPGRCKKRLKALNFFRQLWEAPIEKICLENPKGCASPTIAKYSQIIQPYYFGDGEMKTTCLWLKNLPLLRHYKEKTFFNNKTHVSKPKPFTIDSTTKHKRYFTDGLLRNQQLRSVSFQGIANAMAEQWGTDGS